MIKKIIAASIFVFLLLLGFFFSSPYLADKYINRTILSNDGVVPEASLSFHQQLFIADLHADTFLGHRDVLEESSVGHVDVPRLLKGNVGLQVFSTVTQAKFTLDVDHMPTDGFDVISLKSISQAWPLKTWISPFARAIHQAKRFDDAVARSAGLLWAIETQADFDGYVQTRATNSNMTAGLLAMEGLHALEGKFDNLQSLYDAGYRIMAPVHFFDNRLGGSAHGENKGGLTDFGRQIIIEMDRLSLLVDLAHASPKLIDDVLAISTKPIVVSHTGVKHTCDRHRNLSDKHLLGIAKTGGVIGIGFFEFALCGQTVEAWLNAVLHTINLVGADHVALGSDHDGFVATLIDSSSYAVMTDALLKAGVIESDVAKVMGGNLKKLLLNHLPR